MHGLACQRLVCQKFLKYFVTVSHAFAYIFVVQSKFFREFFTVVFFFTENTFNKIPYKAMIFASHIFCK